VPAGQFVRVIDAAGQWHGTAEKSGRVFSEKPLREKAHW